VVEARGNPKKILVTGAAGFIGSHVVEVLLEAGFSVRAFVRYNSRNSWGWLDDLAPRDGLEIVAGDVRDLDSVTRAVDGCDGIFHLAALIGIPYSYESPLAYIRTNVEGTYNILQAARMAGTPQILVTSTSETYGSAQYVPMDELHPMVAQSPYAATKVAADQMALSFHRSFGLPVKVVRPFNTYGPRQSARAVIPTIVAQITAGVSPIRLGSLAPTRDLTFVTDTARGFLEIFRVPGLVGEVTNIGMNEETSVEQLVRLVAQQMGRDVEVAADLRRVRPDASEVTRLWCDNTKVLARTTWRPAYSLEQGLAETIRWIAEHPAHLRAGRYTV
jgi:dTDP-glucose 4,6-dehydratase